MKYAFYAVADRNKPEDFRWLTVFAVLDHMTCSLPTSKEGIMDTLHYVFKPLTKAQFDTHIAFESLEERDSDTFAIAAGLCAAVEALSSPQQGWHHVVNKPK